MLVVGRCETEIILLVTFEIEKEVHREERIERRSILDRTNILFGKFYAQGVRHRFNVLDGLDTNNGEDVR